MFNPLRYLDDFRRLFGEEAGLHLLRILSEIYENLSQTVTREEFQELKRVVEELAQSQKRTEEELKALSQAQKRTEEELRKLVTEHAETRKRVEGLSDTVGYTLEDRAYRGLPPLLKRYGITVEEKLKRQYVEFRKGYKQINIYGYGHRDGERILILGEAKVRPSKKEIARFERLTQELSRLQGLPVFPLFVAYDFPPEIEELLRRKGILPVWSYELD